MTGAGPEPLGRARNVDLSPAEVAIVVPAYREAATIGGVVASLRRAYPEVVVVDDGSPDATGDCARAAGATVLRHVINRGQGAALKTGIDYAVARGARAVVTFDADGQHRVEDVASLLAALGEGFDVALGSRFLADADAIPAGRRIVLRAAVLFTRLVSGIRVTDAHNGLRAFTAGAARRIELRQDRMAHASEILDEIARKGLRFREVACRVAYTDYSRGKGQRSSAALRIAIDFLLGKWGG